mmetsp:Transcript_41256/g.109362  ORF Transcript_41256/g.109362 Transcript_41256/m.109362 type:complete len:219 (+) Transcript_41256:231-887(+)
MRTRSPLPVARPRLVKLALLLRLGLLLARRLGWLCGGLFFTLGRGRLLCGCRQLARSCRFACRRRVTRAHHWRRRLAARRLAAAHHRHRRRLGRGRRLGPCSRFSFRRSLGLRCRFGLRSNRTFGSRLSLHSRLRLCRRLRLRRCLCLGRRLCLRRPGRPLLRRLLGRHLCLHRPGHPRFRRLLGRHFPLGFCRLPCGRLCSRLHRHLCLPLRCRLRP